jgi:hypothetical protein
MKCPHCKKDIDDKEIARHLAAKGGSAKVAKGFSNPAVLAKALETRQRKKEQK